MIVPNGAMPPLRWATSYIGAPSPGDTDAVVENVGVTGVIAGGRTIATSAASPHAVGPADLL